MNQIEEYLIKEKPLWITGKMNFNTFQSIYEKGCGVNTYPALYLASDTVSRYNDDIVQYIREYGDATEVHCSDVSFLSAAIEAWVNYHMSAIDDYTDAYLLTP